MPRETGCFPMPLNRPPKTSRPVIHSRRPLTASGHFPSTVVEMIAVAEESNTLDTVLVNIADGLERQTERRLDLMVRLLEPVMLLILAGIVLFVVIALLLPIFKMTSTV